MMEVGRGVDIVVATPGRLLDLVNRRAMTLTATRFLVLDEADQMLDLGFIHDLKRIVKLVPQRRQTMLFSATMPKAIAELAEEYLQNPKQVEVSVAGKAADLVEQYVHFVSGKDQKAELLRKSLSDNPDGLALVFMRTKHTAEKLMKHLENIGFSVASIHGNKSQGQRDRALKGFRDGEIRVLVATDVAARGIDVPGVTHVYNFDLPEVSESYVHRIGRTARAGRAGVAIAFCAPDELRLLRDIEKLMGLEIQVASGIAPPDRGRPVKARGGRNGGSGVPNGERREGGNGRGQGGKNHRGQNGRSHERPTERPVRDDKVAAAERGAREERAVSAPRPERDARPARPARPEGEFRARDDRGDRPARPQGKQENRRPRSDTAGGAPRADNRNAEFRGQRAGEPAPRANRHDPAAAVTLSPDGKPMRFTRNERSERPAGITAADGQKRPGANKGGRPGQRPQGQRDATGNGGMRRRSGGGSRQG